MKLSEEFRMLSKMRLSVAKIAASVKPCLVVVMFFEHAL